MTDGIIVFADLPVVSWANGQGSTVELARGPRSGAYDWRLSIATVDRAASFSPLPGIDRSLTPLSPQGLELVVDGMARTLGQYERFDFAGEQDVSSIDQRHPGSDLNLMVRRGFGAPRLEVVVVDAEWEPAAGDLAGIVLSGHLRSATRTLAFGDAVRNGRVRGAGVIVVAGIDAP